MCEGESLQLRTGSERLEKDKQIDLIRVKAFFKGIGGVEVWRV